MKIISPDFETFPIDVDSQAPDPVCLTVGSDSGVDLFVTRELESAFKGCLDSGAYLAGVNIAFDMAVALRQWPELWQQIVELHEAGKIIDLPVLDKCAQIEQRTHMKRPSMAGLCGAYGVDCADKDGDARTTFDQYWGCELEEYSAEHLDYLISDGYSGWKLGVRMFERYPDLLPEAAWLSTKQFWLALVKNRGLKTNPAQVDKLEEIARKALAELEEIATTPMPLPARWEWNNKTAEWDWHEAERIDYSWPDKELDKYRLVRIANKAKGNLNRKRAYVAWAYDGRPPMTREPKKRTSEKPWVPNVATGKEVLRDSGDAFLEAIADYGEWSAVVNKDLKMLREPTLHTRFWIAETTRATSSKPNVQNFRRAEGIRETVVPREGYCFVAIDHTGLELVCAAQSAWDFLGRDDMLQKLNAGIDLHTLVGTDVHGDISYDELKACIDAGLYHDGDWINAEGIGKPFKEYRQFGKIPNFGCLGGMNYPPTLSVYARRQGINMSPEQAEGVLAAWRRQNPDGQALLNFVKRRLPKWGIGFEVPIPGCGLIRRGAPFCAAANTLFQGRGAVLEAHVGWAITKATRDPKHALGQDCHIVNFVHDEFILEVPIGWQSEAGRALGIIMKEAARPFVPDVRIESEVTAMSCWSKNAKSLWKGDELEIWTP